MSQKSVASLEREIKRLESALLEREGEIDYLEEENTQLRAQIPKPDYEDTEGVGPWKENPAAYAERICNTSPFERDSDIKDWAQRQLDLHGENADLGFDRW